MENTKSLTESILQSSEPSIPSLNSPSIPSLNSPSIPSLNTPSVTNSSSFFDGIKNISLTTWLIIILILAFLGFNIFIYLAKGTEDINNFVAPFLSKIFGTSMGVASQTIDVAAEGGKAVVSGTAGAINTGLTAVQDITPNPASSSIKSEPVNTNKQPIKNFDNNTLNKALNTSQIQTKPDNNDYESDYASSSIQGGGKAGWCYIGVDRGHRTCGEVGVNDTCMSGDIFPTMDVCVNPRLRA